jgi:hypothetical protein
VQKPEQPSQQQVSEWAENPVTLEFKRLVEKEIEECRLSMAEAFCPFEPQQTQEIMAGLNGAADTWEKVGIALEGDWTWIMEEESESVRDYPEGE